MSGWFDSAPQRAVVAGALVIYASIVPFLFTLLSWPHGDVRLYYETIEALFSGEIPYRDRTFEYPPYALLWFMIPYLGGSLGDFQWLFSLQIVVIDVLVKWALLGEGMRLAKGIRSLAPLVVYSVAVAFLNHFYLQRLDLIPAALSIGMIISFGRRQFFSSGMLLALATGTKLYPVLFGLPLLVLAGKHKTGASRFLAGCMVGFSPILVLGCFVPWWRFLAFHAERGLEVESFWASVLWFLHFFSDLSVQWTWVKAWQEVTGLQAQAWTPPARNICVTTVALSSLLVSWAMLRSKQKELPGPEMAKILLVPLLPFVAFNIVLSPQYMIWLLVLGAIACLSGRPAGPVLIAVGTVLTPVWYPSREFSSGLNLFQTSVLLFRNLLLIGVWLALLKQVIHTTRANSPDLVLSDTRGSESASTVSSST